MPETLMSRIPRNEMPEQFHLAWDTLEEAHRGRDVCRSICTSAPMLDFVMNKFYGPIFFGGTVDQRYKQLARLRLSIGTVV
jgi:hypothetical protein